MDANAIVLVLLCGALSGVGASLIANIAQRPRTRAEADNLTSAASVSVSADAREWTRIFLARADAAEKRSDAAEARADVAERRVDEVESSLIECYGYVRKLHERLRQLGEPPPTLPQRLEALWLGRDD